MNNIRSITKLVTNHTIPMRIPSLTKSLLILLRYLTVKKATAKVRTTGIIDSNKGLLEDLNGKMKKETTKERKIPVPVQIKPAPIIEYNRRETRKNGTLKNAE